MKQKITLTKDTRTIRNNHYLVRWYGNYDLTTGKKKRYCKSFAKRKDAENFIAEKEKEFEQGMPRDQHDITLGDLCEKFILTRKKSLTKATRDDYGDTIKQLKNYFSPNISIKNIRQAEAEEFIANLKLVHPDHINKGKQLSDSARNKHLKYSSKLFKTAFEWGYIRSNPFQGIPVKKARKKPWYYITPVEFNLIIEHMPLVGKKKIDKKPNTRIKALYSVMYGCGLRYGEVVNLIWNSQNIDFENNRINIFNRPGTKEIPPFHIKDYECRSVPIPKWVVDSLTSWQSEAEEGCPFVFLTENRWQVVKEKWQHFRRIGKEDDWENDMLLNNVLRDFKKHCNLAGIKTNDKLTVHCLRKSYATNLANIGTPAQTLKKLMGHSSIQTTMEFYLRSSDANEKRACEELERMMGEEVVDI